MDDEPSEATAADGKSAVKAANGVGTNRVEESTAGPVLVISPKGDVVLDLDFEVAERASKRSQSAGATLVFRKPPGVATGASKGSATGRASSLKPELPSSFRVESTVLKKHSRYFANLLGDTRFQEARTIKDALAALAIEGVDPSAAGVDRLPRVHIEIDDDGSKTADRKLIFTELLRILHWDGKLVEIVATSEQDKHSSPQSKAAKAPAKSASTIRQAKNTPGKTTAWSSRTVVAKKTQPKSADAGAEGQPHALLPGSHWSAKTPPTLLELATLAVQADRFACTEAVAAYVRTVRIRFPSPVVRAAQKDSGLGVTLKPIGGSGGALGSIANGLPGITNEEAVRQKVFVSWLFEQPLRFHAGTRELIFYGSRQWAAALAGEDQDGANGDLDTLAPPPVLPAWWELPDSIESELQFRRACIINCIASVPRHFLRLYTSRNRRQCKMGYETSSACDSFQLGEIVKFLYHKDLFFLQDFSCSLMSANANNRDRTRRILPSDYAAVDISYILSLLKQCPAYQIDKHHVHCGLRTSLLPIIEYIQAMLGTTNLGLHWHEWAQPSHGTTSWLAAAEEAGLFSDDGNGDYNDGSDDGSGDDASSVPLFGKPRAVPATDGKYTPKEFRFTRAVAGDPRLRLEGGMAASAMARQLFTARRWNWTPEGYEK
ncbi:hydroxyproline-rich glycoprotein [Ophiostoma piceae UAMH 11346]|uniref:Hydroxyproline-rich glycoprotein n=1 Tax=Ophiostoma piceae (strain UAMH 11346) TaxID=1262450 RepID=S3BWK6_OPHP1|nr:hydroxyproline-rich glycoprotein [Ophiostoma piceae UAMH 11346]